MLCEVAYTPWYADNRRPGCAYMYVSVYVYRDVYVHCTSSSLITVQNNCVNIKMPLVCGERASGNRLFVECNARFKAEIKKSCKVPQNFVLLFVG